MEISIDDFIIDKYFGIYTRNGIDYILKDYKHLHIYMIDFDNIKSLNNRMGYKKVNLIFREIFEKLKKNYIIGRVFSGDEILICSETDIDINNVIETCNDFNISFKYKYFEYTNGNLSEIIDDLIENFR